MAGCVLMDQDGVTVVCVAGCRKGGKGFKRPQKYWEERRREQPARILLINIVIAVFSSTRQT